MITIAREEYNQIMQESPLPVKTWPTVHISGDCNVSHELRLCTESNDSIECLMCKDKHILWALTSKVAALVGYFADIAIADEFVTAALRRAPEAALAAAEIRRMDKVRYN